LGRGVDDVEQTLMRAHLELLAALLVDMRRPVDRELLDARRQRNGSAHLGARALRGVDDLLGRRIEDAMVEGFEPNSYVLALHLDGLKLSSAPLAPARSTVSPILDNRRHNAGADGAAALADGETKLLL